MKVKMLVGMAGPTFSITPGEEYDCAQDEAERLIAAGFAAPMEAPDVKPVIERAVRKPASERR